MKLTNVKETNFEKMNIEEIANINGGNDESSALDWRATAIEYGTLALSKTKDFFNATGPVSNFCGKIADYATNNSVLAGVAVALAGGYIAIRVLKGFSHLLRSCYTKGMVPEAPMPAQVGVATITEPDYDTVI